MALLILSGYQAFIKQSLKRVTCAAHKHPKNLTRRRPQGMSNRVTRREFSPLNRRFQASNKVAKIIFLQDAPLARVWQAVYCTTLPALSSRPFHPILSLARGVLPHPVASPKAGRASPLPIPCSPAWHSHPARESRGLLPPSKWHTHVYHFPPRGTLASHNAAPMLRAYPPLGLLPWWRPFPSPVGGPTNLVQFGCAPREPSELPVEPIDQGHFMFPWSPRSSHEWFDPARLLAKVRPWQSF